MKLKISHVCKAISTIKTPNARYHQDAEVPTSLPAKDASVPKIANVTADPTANITDRRNAFFGSVPVPPTKPITKGMLDSEHGVKEVSTPANSANTGASHILSAINVLRVFSQESIMPLPPFLQVSAAFVLRSFRLDGR